MFILWHVALLTTGPATDSLRITRQARVEPRGGIAGLPQSPIMYKILVALAYIQLWYRCSCPQIVSESRKFSCPPLLNKEIFEPVTSSVAPILSGNEKGDFGPYEDLIPDITVAAKSWLVRGASRGPSRRFIRKPSAATVHFIAEAC